MTNPVQPVWLSANFAESGDYHVSLRVSANNDPTLEISVIHDAISGVVSHDLNGNGLIDLIVQDNELLYVTTRDQSVVIASGIFQVSIELIGVLGAVLVPVVSHNLVVDQADRRIIEGATNRALAAVSPGGTGSLTIDLGELGSWEVDR